MMQIDRVHRESYGNKTGQNKILHGYLIRGQYEDRTTLNIHLICNNLNNIHYMSAWGVGILVTVDTQGRSVFESSKLF